MSDINAVLVDDPVIAIAEIMSTLSPFVAFDTEHFQAHDGCSLIQIALLDVQKDASKAGETISIPLPSLPGLARIVVYLFNMVGVRVMHKDLVKLFASNELVKIGCDVSSDSRQLSFYQGLFLVKMIDIQGLAFSLGYQTVSLKYLAKELCGLEKQKSVKHMSVWNEGDWSGVPLPFITYSAYDAVLTLCCYIKMSAKVKKVEMVYKLIKIDVAPAPEPSYSVTDDEALYVFSQSRIAIPESGIKTESYVKGIANCNWLEESPLERQVRAKDVVTRLIEMGIMKQIGLDRERLFL